jgi:fatty acid desaturase
MTNTTTIPELRSEVKRLGLMNPAPRWYSLNLAAHTLLFFGAWAAFAITESVWTAPLVAFAYYQIGLLFHDFGHHHGFRNRRLNDAAGHFAGLLIGGSLTRWRHDHNAHHAHTNETGRDPDIEGPVVHTRAAAAKARGIKRFLARTQHLWLMPVSSVALMAIIRSKDVAFVLRRKSYRARPIERAILAVHYAAYFGIVFATLPFWPAVLFVVVHQVLFGSGFAIAFLVNHTGRPIDAKHSDPILRQVLVTRNVREHPVADYLLGPLAAHIEHHAFPTMPRCNLRRAGTLLRSVCEAQGVRYVEQSFGEAYGDFLGELRAIGEHAPARDSLPRLSVA